MIETHEQAVSYLDSHIGEGMRPGLDNTAAVLEMMGDPHKGYRVVLVTGSNGKTSTTRILSSILTAHGLRVGSFVSPHLESIEERFSLDNQPASNDDFVQAVADVAVFADLFEERTGQRLTYFELTTVIAYSFFATQAVDIAIVEVGMGGRLDATNVADADVAVITGVSLEHTDVLGDTLAEIATEKVGITRPEATLVQAALPDEAERVVAQYCAEHGTERIIFDTDIRLGEYAPAVGGWLLTVEGQHETYPGVYLPLHGAHQLSNCVVAVGAAEAIFGRALSPEATEEGLANATVPGRLEVLSTHPLIVIDGAHNPEGMESAAAAVETAFGDHDWTVIFGSMADKNLEAMALSVADVATHVITTAVDHPRAADPNELAAIITAGGDVLATATTSVAEALKTANDLDTGAILAVGSLYLAGAIRTAVMS